MRNKTKTRKSLNSKQMVQYQVIWHVYFFYIQAVHSKAMQCRAGGFVHTQMPPLQREKTKNGSWADGLGRSMHVKCYHKIL